jgi:Uma2 family endonuclease
LQDVESVPETVEIYQDEAAIHIYRREASGQWSFDTADGPDAILSLHSVGLEIPLAEIYEFVVMLG